MSLKRYLKKRDFSKTNEPKPKIKTKGKIFVIQKHFARTLHYDFRIQIGNSLRSWAVPKNIPKSTKVRRLAILTENHPLEYASFAKTIPKGEYGAGKVEIYDRGIFYNIKKDEHGKTIPLEKSFKMGSIEVFLKSKKIDAAYAIIRFKDKKNWLIVKMKKRNYEI